MTLLGLGLSAHAQNLKAASFGTYELTSGPQDLCPDFTLTEQDLSQKKISLGPKYSFETTSSDHVSESDLDNHCEFKEQNKREDRGSTQVILTRINEEFCKNKSVSKEKSRATLSRNEIHLQQEVAPGASYQCVWKKKTKAPKVR